MWYVTKTVVFIACLLLPVTGVDCLLVIHHYATRSCLPSSLHYHCSSANKTVKYEMNTAAAATTTTTTTTTSGHDMALPEATDHSLVWNPLTGRYIKQTTSSNKRSRWYNLMFERGGYILFKSKLVPIALNNLYLWENALGRKSDSTNSQLLLHGGSSSNDDNYDASIQYSNMRNPDCDWKWISTPSLTVIDDESTPMFAGNTPHFQELLFVHKPSSLLSLPGIGNDKKICLSSIVNEWLLTDEGHGKHILAAATTASESKAAKHDPASPASNKKQNKKRKVKNTPPSSLFLPRPCHRLDFDTSGVMCIALTPDALRTTSDLFESRLIQKKYVALLAGHLKDDCGIVGYAIGKVYNHDANYNEFKCYIPQHQGIQQDKKYPFPTITNAFSSNSNDFVANSLRHAKTEWKVCNRFTIDLGNDKVAKYTRVNLIPHTGRGHQLRLHMAAIGHPILGDTIHAPEIVASASPRLCLHALELEFNVMTCAEDGSYKRCKAVATSIAPF